MEISRTLYDAPAVAGQLIKFSLDADGSVVVTNKNLSNDPYDVRIMALRVAPVNSANIEENPDEDFVDMTPALALTNVLNQHFLTKGHYALRVVSDSTITAWLNVTGEQPIVDTTIDDKLSLVLTQYRESPNLLGMIRSYLTQLVEVRDVLAGMPKKFDIDTAVGEQLTIIGRWLGFPRCHNVPAPVPVFGFDCGGTYSGPYNIQGFCEGALWVGCPGVASLEVCITDDALYRKFLYVRRYQLLGKNDYRSFVLCIKILFGAAADYTQTGRIIDVDPGRALTVNEQAFLRVYERVLPRAIGASINVNI